MLPVSLKLTGFKCHPERELHFGRSLVAITGRNGAGKTNLLDALHHLALTRSAFHKQDLLSVHEGHGFYRLDARLEEDGVAHRMELTWSPETRKTLHWDCREETRLTSHIGRIPLVQILPDEPFLMNESSEWRRNLIDNTLSQTFPAYLQHLSAWKKYLSQRNALLRYFHEKGSFDPHLTDTLDEHLVREGEPLRAFRQEKLPGIAGRVAEEYARLSEGAETVELVYETDERPLALQLQESRRADLEAVRTLCGPHRDDLDFRIAGKPLKKFGSQGQQKTYLLALKLAQFGFLRDQTGKVPWLLLDDIFDKLDDGRISALLNRLGERMPETPVFLTDARPERTRRLLDKEGKDFQEIELA